MRTAFLSSTGADLRDYREVAFQAIQKLDGWKCIRMEDFGARSADVDTFCREVAARCGLFVGIIGHRFGESPEGSAQSFTEREYRAAVAASRPIHIYMADDDFVVLTRLEESDKKLKAQRQFRQELQNSKQHIIQIGFTSPHHLAWLIATDIHNFQLKEAGVCIDPTPYLNALREESAFIDIRGLRVGNEAVYRFPIGELYTPLTTVLARSEGEGGDLRQKGVPLEEALQNTRIVLVGDPGAGKTTFLRRIAFAACETLLCGTEDEAQKFGLPTPCPLPLFVRASSLANFIRASGIAPKFPTELDSPDWLIHYLESASQESNCELSAGFFRQQLNQGSLLLLDGFDEIAGVTARKAVARLVERLARSYPNTHVVCTSRPPAYGGEVLIPGFVSVQIASLEREAVETFVANWCRALHGDGERAKPHQRELLAAIRSQPEIEALALNPVMLTALAALHWNQARLPDQRSELYESVLDWLAKARAEKSGRLSPVECLAMMQHLAYTMQTDPRGRQTEISRHAAARALAPRFRAVPDEEERFVAAERFLEDEEIDSGILISRGNTLRYWHLTFQEYLAAKALAWRDADRGRLLFKKQKLHEAEWRETVLLLVGTLCKQDPERADAFFHEVLDVLGENPSLAERGRCVGLIGSALRDLRAWGYRIADDRYQGNLDMVMAIFTPQGAQQVDFDTRLQAADALGQAGDPRIDSERPDYWVRFDKSAQPQEEMRAFEMGRYPVTVFNFQKFIHAGGYQDEGLWSAGSGRDYHEPDNWQQQLRYPNRPVVGVSWFEAAAYCAWAGGRLPNELEWEYAGHAGTGSRYPWGNEPPSTLRANYSGAGPGRLTPVGLYPAGATHSGVHDLAGNCFEWTADPWRERRGASSDDGQRVVRGGAWDFDERFLAVACRFGHRTDVRLRNLGFRCVRDAK